jgi:site-specific recombinase XerD
VNYVRAKTGKEYSIKLEPEAIEIINRYKGTDLLLNMADRYKNSQDLIKYINMEVKNIGRAIQEELQKEDKDATFPTEISSNWARHSWATIARNDCRINKDDVALCLGHEDMDNKVTDIYIKYDYSIIDRSNRKVIDKVVKAKVDRKRANSGKTNMINAA